MLYRGIISLTVLATRLGSYGWGHGDMQMSPVYASQPYISSDQECRERFQTWAIATYVDGNRIAGDGLPCADIGIPSSIHSLQK